MTQGAAPAVYGPMTKPTVKTMLTAKGYTPMVVWETEAGWYLAYVTAGPAAAEAFYETLVAATAGFVALVPPALGVAA